MPAPDHEREFLDALKSVGLKPGVAPTVFSEDEERLARTADKEPAHTEEVTAPPASVTVANIWRHPDAHPIALDVFLLRQYGPDWLGWEPETLQLLVPDDFKTQSLSDLNLAKIQAVKTLHLVDSYWQRWEVFLPCTMAFNSEFPDFDQMQVPTVAQVLVSVDIANRIREDTAWSDEVKAYIAQVYHHDDIYLPLPPADFVRLDVPESIDIKELARRWTETPKSQATVPGESVMDEQLRRLLTVNRFLEESRTRLQQQLQLHV